MIRLMLATTALALTGAASQAQEVGFLGGGPFHISGSKVVACLDPSAAFILNSPEQFSAYIVSRAAAVGRCTDMPDGLPVLAIGAPDLRLGVIVVRPDVRGVMVQPRYVPSAAVVTDQGKTVAEIPHREVPYRQATRH
jgi:hypothetical protein